MIPSHVLVSTQPPSSSWPFILVIQSFSTKIQDIQILINFSDFSSKYMSRIAIVKKVTKIWLIQDQPNFGRFFWFLKKFRMNETLIAMKKFAVTLIPDQPMADFSIWKKRWFNETLIKNEKNLPNNLLILINEVQ